MKRNCVRRVKHQLCSGKQCVFYLFPLTRIFFYETTCMKCLFSCSYGSHLGPPRRRTTAEEEERAKHPKPEVNMSGDFLFRRQRYVRQYEAFNMKQYRVYFFTLYFIVFKSSSIYPLLQDSVYYHPTLNPTGAPPPGKPPMLKSSIGLLYFSFFFFFSLPQFLSSFLCWKIAFGVSSAYIILEIVSREPTP